MLLCSAEQLLATPDGARERRGASGSALGAVDVSAPQEGRTACVHTRGGFIIRGEMVEPAQAGAPLVVSLADFHAESETEISMREGGACHFFSANPHVSCVAHGSRARSLAELLMPLGRMGDWWQMRSLNNPAAVGYVPSSFVTDALPSGVMLEDFTGESDKEITHVRAGEPVWRKSPESHNGWVIVWLGSGERGAVPDEFVEWLPADATQPISRASESDPMQQSLAALAQLGMGAVESSSRALIDAGQDAIAAPAALADHAHSNAQIYRPIDATLDAAFDGAELLSKRARSAASAVSPAKKTASAVVGSVTSGLGSAAKHVKSSAMKEKGHALRAQRRREAAAEAAGVKDDEAAAVKEAEAQARKRREAAEAEEWAKFEREQAAEEAEAVKAAAAAKARAEAEAEAARAAKEAEAREQRRRDAVAAKAAADARVAKEAEAAAQQRREAKVAEAAAAKEAAAEAVREEETQARKRREAAQEEAWARFEQEQEAAEAAAAREAVAAAAKVAEAQEQKRREVATMRAAKAERAAEELRRSTAEEIRASEAAVEKARATAAAQASEQVRLAREAAEAEAKARLAEARAAGEAAVSAAVMAARAEMGAEAERLNQTVVDDAQTWDEVAAEAKIKSRASEAAAARAAAAAARMETAAAKQVQQHADQGSVELLEEMGQLKGRLQRVDEEEARRKELAVAHKEAVRAELESTLSELKKAEALAAAAFDQSVANAARFASSASRRAALEQRAAEAEARSLAAEAALQTAREMKRAAAVAAETEKAAAATAAATKVQSMARGKKARGKARAARTGRGRVRDADASLTAARRDASPERSFFRDELEWRERERARFAREEEERRASERAAYDQAEAKRRQEERRRHDALMASGRDALAFAPQPAEHYSMPQAPAPNTLSPGTTCEASFLNWAVPPSMAPSHSTSSLWLMPPNAMPAQANGFMLVPVTPTLQPHGSRSADSLALPSTANGRPSTAPSRRSKPPQRVNHPKPFHHTRASDVALGPAWAGVPHQSRGKPLAQKVPRPFASTSGSPGTRSAPKL